MNNDLISREALKEKGTVIGMVNGQKMKVVPLSVIDNAPTVDISKEVWKKSNELLEKRLTYLERPQGGAN